MRTVTIILACLLAAASPGGFAAQAEVVSVTAAFEEGYAPRIGCRDILVSDVFLKTQAKKAEPWYQKMIYPVAGALIGAAIAYPIAKRLATDETTVTTVEQTLTPVTFDVKPTRGATMPTRGGYLLTETTLIENFTTIDNQTIAVSTLGVAIIGAIWGPGAAIGFVAGGGLLAELGVEKHAVILGGAIAGAVIGKKIFDKLIGQEEPDPEVDTPPEKIVEQEHCGEDYRRRVVEQGYWVVYEFNGDEHTTLLPFDPGETLAVDDHGEPIATP